MFGIRSDIPVMPAIRLLWEMMTPLGKPVDPLVYMMTAMSEGEGGLRSRAAGIRTEDKNKHEQRFQERRKTPGMLNAVEMFKDCLENRDLQMFPDLFPNNNNKKKKLNRM